MELNCSIPSECPGSWRTGWYRGEEKKKKKPALWVSETLCVERGKLWVFFFRGSDHLSSGWNSAGRKICLPGATEDSAASRRWNYTFKPPCSLPTALCWSPGPLQHQSQWPVSLIQLLPPLHCRLYPDCSKLSSTTTRTSMHPSSMHLCPKAACCWYEPLLFWHGRKWLDKLLHDMLLEICARCSSNITSASFHTLHCDSGKTLRTVSQTPCQHGLRLDSIKERHS